MTTMTTTTTTTTIPDAIRRRLISAAKQVRMDDDAERPMFHPVRVRHTATYDGMLTMLNEMTSAGFIEESDLLALFDEIDAIINDES